MRYAFIIVALLLTTQLVAQQATQTNPNQPADPALRPATQPGQPSQQIDRDSTRPGTFRDPATATTAPGQDQAAKDQTVRASQILGTNVKNKAGESLGEINDLVINADDGRISYAAVSMGGFLGVGDKLFAVPWEAIECRKENDQHVAVLDVNKQTLENAQGFDEANWPDMTNEQWRMQNDRFYRTARRTHEVARPIQPGTQQPGTQQPREPQPGTQQPRTQQPGAQQPDSQQPGSQPRQQ